MSVLGIETTVTRTQTVSTLKAVSSVFVGKAMREMAECAQISMSVFETQMTVVTLPGVPTHRAASHVPAFKGTEEMVECAMI